MKSNETIFELFEEEEIKNKLPTESNHFIKEEEIQKNEAKNISILESFASSSINYFKDKKHGGDEYFNEETDNECESYFASKNELFQIIYKNSIYNESDFIKLSKIGNGSYGQVYKVKHKETNKIYALKEINKLKLIKENKLYQIYVENEMLKICDHPNIVKYFGFYENKKNFSIITEYCPYSDLSSFLRENQKNLTLAEIQYIIGQIIICLEYLSTKNIIHRDIKPENFLITDSFKLKLIDFGTATFLGKVFDVETNKFIDEEFFNDEGRPSNSFIKNSESNEDHEITSNYSPFQSFQYKISDLFKYLAYPFIDIEPERNNIINKFEKIKNQKFVGTAEYMAPEIINSEKIGYYTDIWSVMCILFFCFTGHNPFTDKTEYLIFQNISNVQINKQYIELISEEALDLIENYFKKDPSERIGYNDFNDFDYQKLKSHPFFLLKNKNLTLKEISKNLMNKCLKHRKSLSKKNNSFSNIININNNNYLNKFEENKNEKNETILKSGLLKKRSPYYYYDKRKIILYDTPKIEYIEPNTLELRGRIHLTKECYAELIKSNQFKLVTPKRTYMFICKERYNISPWVTAINNAIVKYG